MLAPLYIDLLFSKKRAVAEKLKNLAAFGVPLAVGAFAVPLTAEDVALIDEFYLPHKVMGALAP